MNTQAVLPWQLADSGPLAARVAATTARAVVEGRLAPGSLITEVELAATHQVSRTPAREAMVQLEAWGLVRLMPKKGALVTAVTLEERRDLLAVRAMFEIGSVKAITVAGNRLDALADPLEHRLDEQRRSLAAGDLLGFAAADYGFHACVILAGGNAVVAELLEGLGPRLARLTHQVCQERPASLPQLLKEHESLARQARDGDVAGFSATVHAHIRDTYYPATAHA